MDFERRLSQFLGDPVRIQYFHAAGQIEHIYSCGMTSEKISGLPRSTLPEREEGRRIPFPLMRRQWTKGPAGFVAFTC